MLKIGVFCFLGLFGSQTVNAQTNIEVSASGTWLGYMNVFFTDNAFAFGSAWGLPDVKSVPNTANNTITLYPNYNTYANALNGNAADQAYWINGNVGNKIMEGNTFKELTPSTLQETITFSGFVQSNTLAASYESNAFIKVLDPQNSFNLILFESVDLVAGQNFTVSVQNITPGLLVQTGFQVIGLNGNPAAEAANGNVVVTAPNLSNPSFENAGIKMYPNPANDVVNFSANASIENISIYNTLGQIVASANPSNSFYSFNTSDLQSGMYVVKIQSNGLTSTSKLLKK